MKKNIIYIGLALIVGLLAGFLIFNGNSTGKTTTNTQDGHEHATDAASDQMWTCSMHPQIMQPEPGDCPICGMDLIPAESGAEGLSLNEIKMSRNAMALANIQTVVVGSTYDGDENYLTLSGKIMPNEEANAVQASYFEGRIEKLNVNFTGERIRRGQLLATIYAPALVSAQQELLTAAGIRESQPGLYKAVRNKLKLWKLSENQIDQIETSGKVQANFPIYATVSGTVSEKLAEEGDYVIQGQPIVRVSDLGTVWAMFDAYENQISQVKQGQKITVTSNAYPNKEFTATISFIDPRLNIQSRTVSVRATLNNREGILKPGMFVTSKVQIPRASGSQSNISVPASAVLWTGNRSLVYVKTNPNEPIFEMREVTLGPKFGDMYAIVDGLSNGEEVVANGTFTVDAAAQLQGKKSMMNAGDGGGTSAALKERMTVSDKFKNQLKQVFDDYIVLKNALVKEDASGAQKAGKELSKSLKKIDIKLLTDDAAHKQWFFLQKEINTASEAIGNNSEIASQRAHFKHLSDRMISSVQLFGINQVVYVEHCPMADSDKGASWLSLEKEIRNPYYGDAMLKCGEVIETLQ